MSRFLSKLFKPFVKTKKHKSKKMRRKTKKNKTIKKMRGG